MENRQYIGFIGTYTKGESEGIYSFQLDAEAGKITDVRTAAEIENPTYLSITPDGGNLYSVAKDGVMGGTASFSIVNGQLHEINRQMSEGAPPCYVFADKTSQHVFSANYHKGTVEVYPINPENGSLQPPSSIIEHKGSGPDERQEKPHTHYAAPAPDGRYIIAIDLGIDQIITYELNQGDLMEKSSLSVKPGSGPRHLAFHPNGQYAFVMTEFSSEVIALSYAPREGNFKQLYSVSTLPDHFSENNQGSAIHISSDGRFLYAGNRGHDSIAVFGIHSGTAELTFIEHTSTEGNWPRDFVLDPTEKFLIAANQNSSNLVLFSRNSDTGKLTLLQSDIMVPDPVCVKFL